MYETQFTNQQSQTWRLREILMLCPTNFTYTESIAIRFSQIENNDNTGLHVIGVTKLKIRILGDLLWQDTHKEIITNLPVVLRRGKQADRHKCERKNYALIFRHNINAIKSDHKWFFWHKLHNGPTICSLTLYNLSSWFKIIK